MVRTGSFKARKLARDMLRKLSKLAVMRGNRLELGGLVISVRYIQYVKKSFLKRGALLVVHEFPSRVRGDPVESVIDVFEGDDLIATFVLRESGEVVFSGRLHGEMEAIMLLSKLDEELSRVISV